jgi:hypothetical protein
VQGDAADRRHRSRLYADHAVTLARHPSENDERMMFACSRSPCACQPIRAMALSSSPRACGTPTNPSSGRRT